MALPITQVLVLVLQSDNGTPAGAERRESYIILILSAPSAVGRFKIQVCLGTVMQCRPESDGCICIIQPRGTGHSTAQHSTAHKSLRFLITWRLSTSAPPSPSLPSRAELKVRVGTTRTASIRASSLRHDHDF